MSEEDNTDDSQKTEEPSQKKLLDARNRGQVVMSREINNWIMLFVAVMVIAMLAPSVMSKMRDSLSAFLSSPHSMPADAYGLKMTVQDLLKEIGLIWFMPLLFLFIGAMIGPFVQIGPMFSAESIKPTLDKISIFKGISRLFSSKSLMEFLKGIFKLLLVGMVGVIILIPFFPSVEHFIFLDFSQMLGELHFLLIRLFIGVLAVLVVIAIVDYMFQRHDFMKRMRMSKQELKEEYKQTEGDPQVKAHLRELRETKARQRMMASVPEADVVITNPTHYAIALKYDSENMNAPIMLAKGIDKVAHRIKDVANENDIPVIENPPLTRSLYAAMEIGQMIPAEHYKAVAEVISHVFKLKNKTV